MVKVEDLEDYNVKIFETVCPVYGSYKMKK